MYLAQCCCSFLWKTQVLRRKPIYKGASLPPRLGEENCSAFADRNLSGIVPGQIGQLYCNLTLHSLCESCGSRDKKTTRIGRVLRLREQIRCDPARVAAIRQHNSLRRARW